MYRPAQLHPAMYVSRCALRAPIKLLWQRRRVLNNPGQWPAPSGPPAGPKITEDLETATLGPTGERDPYRLATGKKSETELTQLRNRSRKSRKIAEFHEEQNEVRRDSTANWSRLNPTLLMLH